MPIAAKYTTLAGAYSAMTPPTTRAYNMPESRPAKTMARAVARRSGGTRSAVRGTSICGTTEKMPTRKLSASNTARLVVNASPTVRRVVMESSRSMSGRLRTRSPSGAIRTIPVAYLVNYQRHYSGSNHAAYPACTSVGTCETSS
jgi:hypothetical protein